MAAALLLAVLLESAVVAAASWIWSSPETPAVVVNAVAKKAPLAVTLYGAPKQAADVPTPTPVRTAARKKVAVVAQQSAAPEISIGTDEAVVDGPPVIADARGDVSAPPGLGHGGTSDEDGPGTLNGRDLSRYAVQVLAELTANRRVPLQAARMRLQGTVMLEMRIDGRGALGDVRVVASSGHAVLDEAALQTVREAAPFEPPPESRTAVFTVPIRYVD